MLICGAGGFAKELLSVLLQAEPTGNFVFYDDTSMDSPGKLYGKYQIIRTFEEARNYLSKTDNRFALGVGNPVLRHRISIKFQAAEGKLTSIISPGAEISILENKIGDGCTIFNHVVMEADNAIGEGCLVHHAAFISHEVTIGDYCEVSPSVNLLGKVKTGDHCSLGTSSVILPSVHIGNNVIIGAGAVVTKNIPDNSLAVGVPAMVIKKLSPVTL